MHNIAKLDWPFFEIFTVLAVLSGTLLIIFGMLHALESNKGKEESGYENMVSVFGLAAVVMLVFSFISRVS